MEQSSPSFTNKEELSILQSVPSEVSINYLSRLDYRDLENICRTDKTFNRLCRDPEFWKSLVYERFGSVEIPNNINPRVYYRSLIDKFNTTITWNGIDPSTENDIVFTIDENNIDVDRMMIIIDSFEIVVYPVTDRSIIVENGSEVYSISTHFHNNSNMFSYAGEILREINELRRVLQIGSNISTYLIPQQDEIKSKLEILSRNNRVIQLRNYLPNIQDFPIKIIEFVGRKEKITEFVAFIVPLYQYGQLIITQIITHNFRL